MITEIKKQKYWILLVIGVVFLISYLNRWIFKYKFNPVYWENYYYESQWNVPNSKRVISDEGVYRYVGYRLVNGENPFNVDYWVPPLGKYWYGWGAKYLGNPYIISFLFYVFSIIIFKLITSLIFKKQSVQWLTTILFIINPLIVEQISQTMLDLPMAAFLLLTVYLLLLSIKNKNSLIVILAGISLGLMAGVKPPFFIPMFGLVGTIWLYKTKNKYWIYFLPSIVIGYLFSYTCYFIKHPNPIPFIRLHEKIIDFQKNNGGNNDYLNMFKYIFLNKYKGHWVGAKTIASSNWSIILPFGIFTSVLTWSRIKHYFLKPKIMLVISFLTGYLLMLLLIDFWPRYLVLFVPLVILILGETLKNRVFLIYLLILLTLPSLYLFQFPDSGQILGNFTEKQDNGFYKETYQMLSKKNKDLISEDEWVNAPKNKLIYSTTKEEGQWRILLKN